MIAGKEMERPLAQEQVKIKNSMNMRVSNILGTLGLIIGTTVFLASCNDNDMASNGTAQIQVTDAPIDDETISGVYLMVEEIQARGQGDTKVIATFDSPKVFNVLDYQNGATYNLGEGKLEAGMYTELRLVLGDGSYVDFEDGNTEPLTIPSGASSGYKINGEYQISANSTTNVVVDIDLRKALVLTGQGEYMLRPTARLVTTGTSTVYGSVGLNTEDRLVVYAYAEGTYDESEAATPADGETRFEGSINSAVVTDGEFTLAYMQPGDYELILASYAYDDVEEQYVFNAAGEAELMLDGVLLDALELEAETDVDVLLNINF